MESVIGGGLLYAGWRDARKRSYELYSQWLLLPSTDRRTARYWHLYKYDKVYRTEEKRTFYFNDVWGKKNKDPPSAFENNVYYDRVCVCCNRPVENNTSCQKYYFCLIDP